MSRPRLHALLLGEPRGDRRRLSYRGQEHDDLVPARLQLLPGGTPVLLRGAPGRWDAGLAVELTPWNPQPTVEALRHGKLRAERLALRDVRGDGVWSVDAEGRACELAEYDSAEHGRVGVISYAGWRLSDLGDGEVEAVVTRVGDLVYYVVPARAVPAEAPGGNLFREARPARYLREIVKDGRWLRATEIAHGLAEPGAAPSPTDALLGLPALGFDRRREAFARLFHLRDEHREVMVQPNRAMLIPIPATDGGPDFWAWELVDEGNATYLFRPRDRAMGKQLFDWLRDPRMRRQDLLESKDLQARTGFIRRVIHRDAEEPLDAWWARLCEALGRTTPASGRGA